MYSGKTLSRAGLPANLKDGDANTTLLHWQAGFRKRGKNYSEAHA
jgi:hypothetical protein